MHPEQFQTAGKIAAEQMHKLGNGKVEKRVRRHALSSSAANPAGEIGFDHRPAKRPEMIAGGAGTIDMAEHPDVLVEFFGTVERNEEFVGQP